MPSGITLGKLHKVLQALMGWEDSHVHEFQCGGEVYGISDPDFVFGRPLRDERRKRLSSLPGSENDSLRYVYDPGDNWEHVVMLERILLQEKSVKPPRLSGRCRRMPAGGLRRHCRL